MSPSSWRSSVMGLACAAALGLGCGGAELDERDLGNTTTPASGDGDVRTPVVDSEGSVSSFIVGRWVGRAENPFVPAGADDAGPPYVFPSGSTEFQIELSLVDPTTATGQLIFGSGTVPPAFQSQVYPPGLQTVAVSGPRLLHGPLEGLVYPLYEDAFVSSPTDGGPAGALALYFETNLPWRRWCPLQPSRPNGAGGFDCLTPNPEGSCTDESGTYDCDLGTLCFAKNVCYCDAYDCYLSGENAIGTLWLVRDGDNLIGNFADAFFDYGERRYMPVGRVRFERVNP